MTATVEVEPGSGSFAGDAVLGYLAEVLTALGGLGHTYLSRAPDPP